MTLIQSIILGIIQGITEFLPISSSGHLVLIPNLLGWDIPAQDAFVFDVLVQVATLVAVFVYFWDDLYNIAIMTLQGLWKRRPFDHAQSRMGWYLILATIPAGVSFLLFAESFEKAFGSPLATSLFLFGTAVLLLVAELAGNRSRGFDDIIWKDALWVGIFQILAIFPGVSRSGSTITASMIRDLKRPAAARFSFLISVPVMLAAGLVGTIKLFQIPHFASLLPTYLAGFITAAIAGYVSIRWLLQFLTHRPLYIFAAYCSVFGLLNLLMILL
ncbi:MAG: undecaprenyl-diphosphatase UppP [Chloroflexota bacterium]|nr:undecaprenyl-diphosphatase UppP [Chloroflexota bacterium]